MIYNMAHSYTSLDKRLKKALEVAVKKVPVTRYLATSPEEEELIRKARELGPKKIESRIEDRVFGNDVVAEGIEIKYPTYVHKREPLAREVTHRVFSGSGRLLDHVPLFIIVHQVTDRAIIDEKLGIDIEITRKEAITATHDEIDGRNCVLLYSGSIFNGNDIYRKLLEICVERDNGEGPHLYVREVINDLERERIVNVYDTRKGEKSELHYLDPNLALRPENIKAISQSLEQIIEMMKKGMNPLLDKEASEAILGVIKSIDNISKRSENGVPLTKEFYKSLEIGLPYYSKHLSEARK